MWSHILSDFSLSYPRALGHMMFTCIDSGSNDLTLRIVRAFTHR